ncbi:hypothetical protein [uncultured Pseudoteredinibacter sp.]|uniref:hypothetical protein n=1 Tax=uncultured Pseudoteredinibacter sp. TaxID=1641701 RepID=UPI00261EE445|nr:hypothetical protein [uncultured Pseudoteredinibacter sp.]
MDVSAKLDYKVSIEKLIIEKEIAPKRSFESKPVLILIGGRLPVLVHLKGEFGWEMKATVDPGVGFSLELTANPMVHERVVAGELIGIKHTSHSGLGEAQSSQTLSGTGNVEAGLIAVGTITIVGWDALTLSAEPKFASSLEASVEAVPKYEVLKEYYGDTKIQIGKFTTGTKGDMSLIAAINIPFSEVLDISRDFELFDRRLWELPNISLSSTSDECSTVTHMASIDDSKKGHVYSKTLAWGSVVDGIRGYREGPSGEKEWVQGYPDSTITTVVSGYGELGESFRRYTAVDFTPASTLRYYVEGFGENAYGVSPSQACQRWADKIGSNPDYVLISSDGGMCVWAYDGVSETDLDFYWPVDSVDTCQ